MSTIEIAATAQARLCGAHPEGSVRPPSWARPRQLRQLIALAAADPRDDSLGDAFFNAALRRAKNLKDAFLMVRSLY